MSLRQRQSAFAKAAAELILRAEKMGYRVTLGDAYRDPRNDRDGSPVYGSKSSLHRQRLAIDLNLFARNDKGRWVYVTTTEGHAKLGEWWEANHRNAIWGGRWDDGNHYQWRL